MQNAKEFLQEIVLYFGGFPNERVMQLYATELRYVKPSDLDRLFKQLIIDQPQAFCPDYKALSDAIKKSKIELLDEAFQEARICKVCGKKNFTSGICPECKYDGGVKDGTPEEYRAIWIDWKNNGPRYDVGSMMKNILKKRSVQAINYPADF